MSIFSPYQLVKKIDISRAADLPKSLPNRQTAAARNASPAASVGLRVRLSSRRPTRPRPAGPQ
jgi:hypothetical protein